MRGMAHLFRDKIKCFAERVEKALVIEIYSAEQNFGMKKGEYVGMSNDISTEITTPDVEIQKLCTDSAELIHYARNIVVKQVNIVQIMTYYSLGRWIVETQQMGQKRAKYGSRVIQTLSEELQKEFGKGFSEDTLKNARKFYLTYKDRISETVFSLFAIEKSKTVFSLFEKDPPFTVSWSHYLQLMRIENEDERSFYEIEASKAGWGVRTLQRQYNSSLYERLALSRDKKDALVEITLPQNANIYASEYKLYLPDKKLLQQKLKEWIEEEKY